MTKKKENVPKLRFPEFTSKWEEDKLENISKFRRGSFPQPYGKKEWYDGLGSMPFVQVVDVKDNLTLVSDTKQKISKIAQPQSVFVKSGSVIVTLQGSIGRVAITDYDVYIDRTILIFERYYRKIYCKFWGYIIQQKFHIEKKRAPGGTIKTITKEALSNFDIMIPEYIEQKKIGEFFNNIDSLITLHQRKLNNIKKLKAGLLQKMFPKKGEVFPEVRFPGFMDAWEQRRLGDNSIIKGRLGWKSLKQEEYTQEGPNMIAGKHINDGVIDWDKVDHIPRWRYDESPDIMLEDGDVIFSKDGSLGNPAFIENLQVLATINSTMMLVRTDDTIDSKFFYQVLRSEQFQRLIYLKVSGSSIPHLFQADMNEFKFFAPSIDEQKKLSVLFEKVDNLITFHQQKLEHLKKQKKALLQQMFV